MGFAVPFFPLPGVCAGSCAPKPRLRFLGKALARPTSFTSHARRQRGLGSPAALCLTTSPLPPPEIISWLLCFIKSQ